eukprot:1192158-Prorocentrum_minimum.AAC.3
MDEAQEEFRRLQADHVAAAIRTSAYHNVPGGKLPAPRSGGGGEKAPEPLSRSSKRARRHDVVCPIDAWRHPRAGCVPNWELKPGVVVALDSSATLFAARFVPNAVDPYGPRG